MLSPRLQLLLESLQKLLRRGANSHATRMLARARPVDVSVVMRFLDDRQRRQIFDLLPNDEMRAEVLAELDSHLMADVVAERSADDLKPIVEHMSLDDQADVLATFPEELRQRLIDALHPHAAEEVEDLLHYDPETAGGLMSPEYFALRDDTTAADAIAALQRASQDVEMAYYVYVINEHGHLLGVASLRALVTHPPATPLKDLMASDVISVTTDMDQEEVARLAARYNLLAIPVVDEANRLVGIVTIDDLIDVIREEATEDILKMAGADETALEGHSVFRNVRVRAPWLFATWMGGLAASLLIGLFEHQLEAQVALAAFIPIVLGMGGNVGIQTATIMVRGIATGRVNQDIGWRYLTRETSVGVLLGVLYGLLLAGYALLRYSAEMNEVLQLALTVGLSVLASMSVAAGVGAVTPLMFERLGIDPAVATGPIVTTAVDVLAILSYFLVASLVLGNL